MIGQPNFPEIGGGGAFVIRARGIREEENKVVILTRGEEKGEKWGIMAGYDCEAAQSKSCPDRAASPAWILITRLAVGEIKGEKSLPARRTLASPPRRRPRDWPAELRPPPSRVNATQINTQRFCHSGAP